MAEKREKPAWYLAMPVPLLAGMAVCQVAAAVWVGLENRRLHEICLDLLSRGWSVVPNAVALPEVVSFSQAFNGGLFYTFTVGAGLAMLFFLAGRLLFFAAGTGKGPFISLLAAAFVVAGFINRAGFVPFPSLMILLCCVAAILLTRLQADRVPSHRPKLMAGLFVAPVVVLAASWAFAFSPHLFDQLRDDLLLKSRAGIFVNDFYYRYTLSAANCFKSLEQKKIVPVFLEGFETRDALRLERSLARHDWLSVSKKDLAACVIKKNGGQIIMGLAGRAKVEVEFKKFISSPDEYLTAFSRQTDRHAPFRRLIFFCLLFGFPLALYTIIFGLVRGISGIWAGPEKSCAVAAICCVVLGLAALLPLLTAGRSFHLSEKTTEQLLASDEISLRVAGLRRAFVNVENICGLVAYNDLSHASTLVEKRWLSLALAHATCPQAHEDLMELSRDEHPNVRSLAVYALALHGDSRALARILEMLKNETHWYAQWYAYNAARSLGWQNRRS